MRFDIGAVRAPRIDEPVGEPVVEPWLRGVRDDDDGSGLRPAGSCGLDQLPPGLEESGVGMRREPWISVRWTDPVPQLAVPAQIEVRNPNRQRADRGEGRARYGPESEHRCNQHGALDVVTRLSQQAREDRAARP